MVETNGGAGGTGAHEGRPYGGWRGWGEEDGSPPPPSRGRLFPRKREGRARGWGFSWGMVAGEGDFGQGKVGSEGRSSPPILAFPPQGGRKGSGEGARERRGVGGHGGDGCEGGMDGSPHPRGHGEGGGDSFFSSGGNEGWIWGRCGDGGFHGGMVARGVEGMGCRVQRGHVGSGREGWGPRVREDTERGGAGTAGVGGRARMGPRIREETDWVAYARGRNGRGGTPILAFPREGGREGIGRFSWGDGSRVDGDFGQGKVGSGGRSSPPS